ANFHTEDLVTALIDALYIARSELAFGGDLDDSAGKLAIGIRVHGHGDGLPVDDFAEVRFEYINADPQVPGSQYANDGLAGRHEVAFAHGNDLDDRFLGRPDGGFAEIGVNLLELGAVLRHAGLRLRFFFGSRTGQEQIEPRLHCRRPG